MVVPAPNSQAITASKVQAAVFVKSSPRPGARQDVAALAAFLASFGGGAGLNCRERCGWVFGCVSKEWTSKIR